MSVEDANIVDLVTLTPDGQVVLYVVEGRPWDQTLEQLYELQEKLNRYVAFIESGELVQKYPAVAGRPVRIERRCASEPLGQALDFIERAGQRLAEAGLLFSVRVIE